MNNSKPTFDDKLALFLLKVAKMKRKQMKSVEEDYEAFYESFFENKDTSAYDKDPRMNRRHQTLNQYFEDSIEKGSKVVDFGCGLGDVIAALPSEYDFYGMDYAKSNIDVAKPRLEGKANIEQGNIYELPYEDNTFDVGICLEVLEHIEDDERAVREICRVLKPGGRLIAAVPYTYYWPEYQELLGHFRHYSRESFSELMAKNGLEARAFLPNFANWHQAFTRRYCAIRFWSATVGRLLGKSDIYDFCWPWSKKTSIEKLSESLQGLQNEDAKLDYKNEGRSTFLVAYKPE